MLYSHDCLESPQSLAATREHVIAHLSSVCSPDDSPTALASEVKVTYATNTSNDMVRVTGEIDRKPAAFYLQPDQARSLSVSGTGAPALVLLIQEGLTRYGVPWRVLSGAQTRGNGQVWGDINGAIMHHTATAVGNAPSVLWLGRSDLSGPLCNTAGEADGTVAFVAYYPANHAGASGGRSMGPLPTTTLFNKRVWGHEIVYPGVSPMTDAQYRSAIILGRVMAEILGVSVECIRAHGETSITGKWDPGYANGKTINMSAFRSDAANATVEEEPDLDAKQAAQLDTVLAQLTGSAEPWKFVGYNENEIPKGPMLTLVDLVRRALQIQRSALVTLQILAQAKAIDIDEAAIAAQVVEQMSPLVHAAVLDALGDDNQETADLILDALKNRL